MRFETRDSDWARVFASTAGGGGGCPSGARAGGGGLGARIMKMRPAAYLKSRVSGLGLPLCDRASARPRLPHYVVETKALACSVMTIPRWRACSSQGGPWIGGLQQSSSLWWRVGVDGEAVAVDHDLVVEPAHRRQILRVGAATVDPPGDVMHLQPIPARTARDGACRTVTIHDEAAHLRRDRPGCGVPCAVVCHLWCGR